MPDEPNQLPTPAPADQSLGRSRLRNRVVTAAAMLLVLALIGAIAGGFFTGSRARTQAQQSALEAEARGQFDLAIQDLRAGRYAFAQQRLQYVLNLDPNFPAASAMLQQALLGLHATPTPTPTATPIPTPTLDLPRVQQLMGQAQQEFQSSDWAGMIHTLLSLKVSVPDYQPARVNGLMYVAFSEEGVSLINQGELEQGIANLDQAELYGPLDNKTSQRRQWAELLLNVYQEANIYFTSDSKQSVADFAEAYSMAPNYGDILQEYPQALQKYGDQLMGKNKPCEAASEYQAALNIKPNDSGLQKALDSANSSCTAQQAPPPTASAPTPTP